MPAAALSCGSTRQCARGLHTDKAACPVQHSLLRITVRLAAIVLQVASRMLTCHPPLRAPAGFNAVDVLALGGECTHPACLFCPSLHACGSAVRLALRYLCGWHVGLVVRATAPLPPVRCLDSQHTFPMPPNSSDCGSWARSGSWHRAGPQGKSSLSVCGRLGSVWQRSGGPGGAAGAPAAWGHAAAAVPAFLPSSVPSCAVFALQQFRAHI